MEPPDQTSAPVQEKPSLLRRAAPALAATALGVGTYAALRKFRPSAVPELRALQEQAKNKSFEVATAPNQGRGLRSLLFGARDIPANPLNRAKAVASELTHPNATVLKHTADSARMTGGVNINAGSLPDALDDKYIFSRVMTGGTGGAEGMPGAVPRTELLRDALQRVREPGNLKKDFGGFVVKPRTGSMSKAESLLTEATDRKDPRMQAALRNPGEFIVQEKIPIQNEFRVHMLNNTPFTASYRQMPNKTLRGIWDKYMGGGGGAFVPVAGDERHKLMDFARNATKHIGDTAEGNVLGKAENLHHALDIARLPDGSFKVIESNPTPGTLMNPIISRKLQHLATGRVPKDVAALSALGVGGLGAAAAQHSLKQTPQEPVKTASLPEAGPVTVAPEQAQTRFNELRGLLNTHGVLAGTGHKRIVIPKDRFTERDINDLGFVPVSVAIPEAGQDRFQSFRHPDMNFHLHSHPEGWTMHEDAHASSTMLAKKEKTVGGKTRAMLQGLPHVNEEGLPGLYYYMKGQLAGQKSTAQRVLGEMTPEGKAAIQGLSLSHTYQPQELAKAAEAKKFKLHGYQSFQGLRIAIENPKNSVRSGVDKKTGKPWRTVMKYPYGYFVGSKGADGEGVDCYVGPNNEAEFAFVVHQNTPDGKRYDEDKVMLGFESEEEAKKAFQAHYDSPNFLGPIAKVPMSRLKELLAQDKPLEKISHYCSGLAKLGAAMTNTEVQKIAAQMKEALSVDTVKSYAQKALSKPITQGHLNRIGDIADGLMKKKDLKLVQQGGQLFHQMNQAGAKAIPKVASAVPADADALGRGLAQHDAQKIAMAAYAGQAGAGMAKAGMAGAAVAGLLGDTGKRIAEVVKANPGAAVGGALGLAHGLKKDEHGNRSLIRGVAQGAAGAGLGAVGGRALQHLKTQTAVGIPVGKQSLMGVGRGLADDAGELAKKMRAAMAA